MEERIEQLIVNNKETFQKYLVEDCLKSLYSIKTTPIIDKVCKVYEKYSSVSEEELKAFAIECFAVNNIAWYAASALYNKTKVFWYAYTDWAINSIDMDWHDVTNRKYEQYLRFAKKLVYKPNFPQNYISYILNSQTEEELNVWLIDYAQEKSLPDVREYISFLYEKEYDPTLIIGNKELEHLLN